MTINSEILKNHIFAKTTYSYSDLQPKLYAFSLGLGKDPLDSIDLKYLIEKNTKVLPSFAVIPPFENLMGLIDLPGMNKVGLHQILHGEQTLEIINPIPVQGKIICDTRIKNVLDKGKAAVIEFECVLFSQNGEHLANATYSIFVLGEGGFGGERGAKSNFPDLKSKLPENSILFKTTPEQALIYRLNGDRNPLHSDPEFAKMMKFEKPILHGLCTYGICAFQIQKQIFKERKSLKKIGARFSHHVFPGETLEIKTWKKDENSVYFEAWVSERSQKVISHGVACF